MNSNNERGYRITATECNESMKYDTNGFNWQCQRHLDVAKHGSPADRSSALFDLEKLLTETRVAREKKEQEKFRAEREEEERKRSEANRKVITVGEMERLLESFTFDRKHYRDRCSHFVMSGTNQDDRDFSHLFRNFVRNRLNLPAL